MKAEALLCQRSLLTFVKEAWHVLEPSNPFTEGWHFDAIAEHLQAVSRGQIRRLIINMPPRHGKSLLVSVFWPCWEWTFAPHVRWLYTTYAKDLTLRDSVKCRWLLESPWYKEHFGDVFNLLADQNVKSRYETDKRGYRLATSTDGQITGEGGDRLVLDDPHNVREAESEVERQNVKDFVDRSWSSRANNPKTVTKVVVMQRVHQEDITAHLLAKEAGWTHLVLPTEYQGKPVTWFNGKGDPRTKEGELLWPARFGPAEVREAARDMGEYGFNAQHLQDPRSREGGMFNMEMLKKRARVCVFPDSGMLNIVRGWDLAATEKKHSKRTAGVKISQDEHGRFFVHHVVLGKWAPDKRNTIMTDTSKSDDTSHVWAEQHLRIKILFEHEGGSSGVDQALAVTKMLAGHRVEGVLVSGDKAVRADAFAAQCNVGNVYIIDDGTWNVQEYLTELERFSPTATYKDQVDASSLAFNWVVDKKPVRPLPAARPPATWTDNLPAANWTEKL